MLTDRPLVCVEWLDAHGSTVGEHTIEEIQRDRHKPAPILTFGLLLIDDEKGITVASEITGTEERDGATTYRGVGFIPRGMVREVIPLGVPKKKKPSKTRTPSRVQRLPGEVPLPFANGDVAVEEDSIRKQ
jgi:hypothetical protein